MSAPSRSVPWIRWVLAFLLLSALGVLGKYLYTQKRIESRLKAAIAQQDRDYPGWRLTEIQAAREQVPDHENAALVVMAAHKLAARARLDQMVTALSERPTNVGVPAWRMDRIKAGMEPLAPAVAEARKLEKMERGRFPVVYPPDVLGSRLEGVQDARMIASLMNYDSLIRAEKRDLSGAMSNCMASLNAARAISDEPNAICMLVRIAVVTISCSDAEWLLGQGEPPEDKLVCLQSLLVKENRFPLLEVVARGELAGLNQVFESLENGTITLESLDPEMGRQLRKRWLGILEIDIVREAHADMFPLYNPLVDIARRPAHERPALMAPAVDAFGTTPHRILAIFAPAMQKIEEAERRRLNWVRCTIAGLAAERYRRTKGEFPKSIDDLKEYAPADALVDPGDGKPLRLKREPGSLLIYCIGPNLIDDGGTLDRANPSRPGIDHGFRLWEVNERGKPAPKEDPPPPEDPGFPPP